MRPRTGIVINGATALLFISGSKGDIPKWVAKAGHDLKDEQKHRSAEISQRDFLTLIFHDGAPQPALFGGQS
jgi:hypothetical protein